MKHLFYFVVLFLLLAFLFGSEPDLWSTLIQQRNSYIKENYQVQEIEKPPESEETEGLGD